MKILRSFYIQFPLQICLVMSLILGSSIAPARAAEKDTGNKNPWMAAGLSLLVPGSGQMYVEEEVWPEILITAGMALALATFFWVDQQRSASIRPREIGSTTQNLADAHWDALTLILQIAVPSLWLWNAGDAYKRAEDSGEKVIPELERFGKAYIIEENLVSVTLWQF